MNFNINVIDIIGCAVILLAAAFGARKGLFRVLIHFAAYVLALFAARMCANPMAQFIYDKFLQTKVTDYIDKMIPSGESVMLTFRELLPDNVVKITDFFHLTADNDALNSISSALSVEKIESGFIQPLVLKVLFIVSTVLLFVILSVILRIVAEAINNFIFSKKHKKLSAVNKFFGFIVGLLKGAIPVFIGCEIVNLIAPLISNIKFTDAVTNSYICSFIAGIIK